MRNLSDNALITNYINGCEKSLEFLVNRYQSDLYSFIYYKVLNEDLANDIFQDTFVKIITTLKQGRYHDEGKFVVWAKRIAYNLVIDYFRLKKKHSKVSETTYGEDEFSIFDIIREPDENVEEQMITDQINQDLMEMIKLLPENQQEVLELRFFKGLSFKEIADETDSSINTTLGRVRYALINLRKIMEDNKIILTR